MLTAAKKVAKALNIHGAYNAQFIVKDSEIKIIETNIRASRSFPFVSKVLDVDFIQLATRIMMSVHMLIWVIHKPFLIHHSKSIQRV